MSRFLSLVLILGICNNPISTVAHADEPHNRAGIIANKPAILITQINGCPIGITQGSQYMYPGDAAVLVKTDADALGLCFRAKAEANAVVTTAQAHAASEILLADAASQVLRAPGSEPVYVNARKGIVATGPAASLAAVDSNLGGTGMSPWVTQGARDLAALSYLNGPGGYVMPQPPPAAPSDVVDLTDSSDSPEAESDEEAEPEPTPEERLKAAEERAKAAMVRAGIK